MTLPSERMPALSRAAEEVSTDVQLAGQSPAAAHFSRWPLTLAASVLGLVIGVELGLLIQPTTAVRASPDRVPVKAPVSIPRVQALPPAEFREAAVRFKNPFDASEVFAFPPATSAGEARRLVAEALLQRARKRQVAVGVKGIRPVPGSTDERAQVAQNAGPRGT